MLVKNRKGLKLKHGTWPPLDLKDINPTFEIEGTWYTGHD